MRKTYKDKELKMWVHLMEEVALENEKQLYKWGVEERPASEWIAIMLEEAGELSKAVLDSGYEFSQETYEEAIQLATIALKIAEMSKPGQEE